MGFEQPRTQSIAWTKADVGWPRPLRVIRTLFKKLLALPRVATVIVAVAALAAIVVIVVIALSSLPPDDAKNPGQNGETIIAIATAAFGVIGATVGAFFAVRAAGSSVDEQAKARKRFAGTRQRRD